MEGYINLHRTLLDSMIFSSQTGLKIWIWLLLKASYRKRHVSLKIGKGETTVTIERGQLLFGRYKAEEELCIDGSTIYRWIKKLEENGMISIESSNQYSIITICNYDTYQTENEIKEQPKNSRVTTNEQQMNSRRTASEQQVNTYNKDNKVNKVNKDNNIDTIKSFDFKKAFIDLDVDVKILEDWLKVRKAKKAVNTQSAFNSVKKKMEASGKSFNECVTISAEKSWAGFDIEWLKDKQTKYDNRANITKLKEIVYEDF
jgi:hypothetical protein